MTNWQTLELEAAEAIVQIAILVILVFVIAFFVAAELALVSASRGEIYNLSQNTNDPATSKTAQLIHDAQNNLEKYLSVTQTGTTAGSLLLGWLGEDATVHWIERIISQFPIGHLPKMITSHSVAATIAFLLVTYIEIVLGELVPKVIATNAPEKTALRLIRPLQFCSRLFFPALVILNGTVRLLTGRITRREVMSALPASDAVLVPNDAHSVFVSGTLDLLTLNDKLQLDLPINAAYSTLAGFMIHQLGRVPAQGDRVQWSQLEFEAVRVTESRLETILLRQVTQPLVDLNQPAFVSQESLASSP